MQHIHQYIEVNGIYDLKVRELGRYLEQKMPESMKVPSASTLERIIKDKFCLKFTNVPTTCLRYHEDTFEEKRLWTSRLLAQFMHDGAIIISLDESNFKSGMTSNRCWQFNQHKNTKVF